MKLMTGVLLGGAIVAGTIMMYNENIDTKKIYKRGRQIVKRMF